MANQKSYGLSVDIEDFVRHALTDPDGEEQVMAALEKGPAEIPTDPLGACNLGTNEDRDWYSLFVATAKDIPSGDPGHLIRPKSDKTKGRIILNMREQTKDHQASRSTLGSKIKPSATSPSQGGPTPMTDDVRQNLLSQLKSQSQEKVAPEVPAEAQAALPG